MPRLVGEGQEIYTRKLPVAEAMGRIDAFYRPYHRMLERLVERTHARFGLVVLIDCHSMPASVRIGETGLRPDFIIGDRFGTSCSGALTEHAIGALARDGLHRRPQQALCRRPYYRTLWPPRSRLPCTPDRDQIAALYLDEHTLVRTGGFCATCRGPDALWQTAITQLPPEHFARTPARGGIRGVFIPKKKWTASK